MTELDISSAEATPHQRLVGLTRRSAADLAAGFAQGEPDIVPAGRTTGLCLPFAGTFLTRPLARLYSLFWKGKIFDSGAGRVVNRILPFDMSAITTSVEVGESRMDGKPCVVIDYSELGFVGRRVRDEIRRIEPGLYLAYVHVFGRPVMMFALADDDAT